MGFDGVDTVAGNGESGKKRERGEGIVRCYRHGKDGRGGRRLTGGMTCV